MHFQMKTNKDMQVVLLLLTTVSFPQAPSLQLTSGAASVSEGYGQHHAAFSGLYTQHSTSLRPLRLTVLYSGLQIRILTKTLSGLVSPFHSGSLIDPSVQRAGWAFFPPAQAYFSWFFHPISLADKDDEDSGLLLCAF